MNRVRPSPPPPNTAVTPKAASHRTKAVGGHSIAETAELTGLTAAVLRIWELRYGWPIPRRHKNNYRYYTKKQVKILKIVKVMLDEGHGIGEILTDPKLNLMSGKVPMLQPPRPVLPEYDFSHIPLPTSDLGKSMRTRLERAMREQDAPAMALLKMEAVRLRPAERDLAVGALLRLQEG